MAIIVKHGCKHEPIQLWKWVIKRSRIGYKTRTSRYECVSFNWRNASDFFMYFHFKEANMVFWMAQAQQNWLIKRSHNFPFYCILHVIRLWFTWACVNDSLCVSISRSQSLSLTPSLSNSLQSVRVKSLSLSLSNSNQAYAKRQLFTSEFDQEKRIELLALVIFVLSLCSSFAPAMQDKKMFNRFHNRCKMQPENVQSLRSTCIETEWKMEIYQFGSNYQIGTVDMCHLCVNSRRFQCVTVVRWRWWCCRAVAVLRHPSKVWYFVSLRATAKPMLKNGRDLDGERTKFIFIISSRMKQKKNSRTVCVCAFCALTPFAHLVLIICTQ